MTASAATDIIRARIDPKIKQEATEVLDSMGLSMTDVIRMLVIRVAKEKALPFEVRVPNDVTRAAMLEAREMTSARFGSKEELFHGLEETGKR